MSSYIFDYLLKNNFTNYKYQNMNNVYNFIYDITNENNEEEIEKAIKKNIGLTFYEDYKTYLFRKNLISK